MVPTLRRLGGLALCALLTACPTTVTTPVANPGNNQDAVAVGSTVLLDGSKSDAGGREVTYTWSFVSLPAGSHAQLNDPHSVTPSFVADVDGQYVVQLVVSNAFLSSAPKSVTITVTKCGANVPTTGALASATVPSSASLGVGVLVQLSAPAAADVDNAPAPGCNLGQTETYAWSIISQPAGSKAQLNNASALQPSFTPDVAGDYLIRLFITDSTGRTSAPGDLKITVPDCGSNAPSVDSLSATPSAPGIGSTVQLNPTVSDRDNSGACNLGQTFSYAWTALQLPPNSHAQLNNATATNPSFVPDVAGDYVFRLIATDSTSRPSLPKDIKVTATACGGNAPVAGFSFLPAAPGIGTAVQLTAAPTDADNAGACSLGQTFSFAWSIASLPSGSRASLNNPTSSNPTLVPDVAGDYLVQLVVTDSTGLASAPLVQKITASSCGAAAPSVTALAGPASAPNPGAAVNVASTVASNEPTGCPAPGAPSYRWTLTRPSGSSAFLADPTATSAAFTTDVAGSYQLSLVITAQNGKSSAPRFITVTTNNCGLSAPVIGNVTETPTGGTAGQAPNPGSTVLLAAAVSDVDNLAGGCNLGQTESLTWSVASGPSKVGLTLTTPFAATPAAVSFVPDQLGTYQLQVVATDSAGFASAPAFLTFTTTRCGANAPTITSAGVITAPPSGTSATVSSALPQAPLSLLVAPDDVDNAASCGAGQTLTPAWKLNQKPSGSNAVIADPTALSTAFTPDLPGDYQLSVTVTDSTGLSSSPASVSVHVVTCGTAAASVAGAAILSTANPGNSAVAKLGYGVTLTSGTIVSNNCLLPVEVQTGSGASFNLAAGSKLDVLVGGVRSSHTFASATTTAAGVIASINGDGALSYSARAAGSGVAIYSRPPSGATPPYSLGAELQVVPPSSGPDASVTLALPSGQRATAASVWSWSLVDKPAGSQAVLQPANGATPSFVPDVPGAYVAKLVVTNGLGYVSDPQYVTVTPVDCASTLATAFSSVSIGSTVTDPQSGSALNVGGTVQLSGNFVDANAAACGAARAATPYAYHWALIARPAGSGAALTSAGDASPSFIPDVQGSYTVSFSVSDALGAASSTVFSTFTTSACGANAPQASIALRDLADTTTVASMESLHPILTKGTASDADDACPARFNTASGLPAGAAQFTFAWSVVSADPGVSASLSGSTGSAVQLSASTAADASVVVGVVATATKTGLSSPLKTQVVPVLACGGHKPQITRLVTKQGGNTVSRPALGAAVSIQALVSDVDVSCGAGDTIGRFAFTPVQLPSASAAQIALSTTTNPNDTGSFTPDVAGTYRYSVTATDSTGLTSDPVLVELTTATCAPGLTGTPITAATAPFKIGQTVTLTPGAYAANGCVANSTPVYAWSLTSRPSGSAAALSSASAASPAFVPDLPGTYVAQLVLADNGGNVAAPYSLPIAVATCGTAQPVICDSGAAPSAGCAITNPIAYKVGGSAKAAPDSGDVVALSAPSVYDPNSALCAGSVALGPMSWRWSLLQKPAGSLAELSSTTAAQPNLVPDAVGQYQVSVVTTDALGNASNPAILTFSTSSCGANTPAPAIAGSASIHANALTTYTGSANDLDLHTAPGSTCPAQFDAAGSPLLLAWSLVSSAPGAAVSLVPAPDGLSAAFSASAAGTYVLGLTATDPTGRHATVLKTVTVDGCGANAPTITTVVAPSSNPPVTSPASTSTLQARVSDADNAAGCGLAQTFTFNWRLVSAPAGSAYQIGAALLHTSAAGLNNDQLDLKPDRAGTYALDVTATDSAGVTSAPFRVDVTAGTECAPTGLSILANGLALPHTFAAGTTVTFAQSGALGTLCVADTTPTSIAVHWNLTARPAGSNAAVDPQSGVLQPDVPGVYTVQEVATDSGGYSASAQGSVTIGACQPVPALSFTATFPPATDETASGPYSGDRINLTASIPACGGLTPSWSYAWTLVGKPATSGAVLGGASTPSASFVADVPGGNWQVALTVSDGLGNTSVPAYATVTTKTCGANGPTFSVSPATTTVNTGALSAAIGVAGLAYPDASGCPARFDPTPGGSMPNPSYTWSVVSGPPGGVLSLSSTSTPTIQVQSSTPGSYGVGLIITDGRGVSSVQQTGAVTVDPCGSYAPLATQIDATGNGTTATTTYDAAGVGTPTAAGALAARYAITLVPTVTDQNVTCGALANAQVATHWTLTPPAGSFSVLSNPDALTPSFVPDKRSATYNLAVTLSDQTGHSRTQSFAVTTTGCGDHAPALSGPVGFGAAGVIGLPSVLQITGADADTTGGCALVQPLSYAWSFTSVPSGSTVAFATTPTVSGSQAVFTPDKVGAYAFTVVATDPTGLSSAPAPGTVTVAPGAIAALDLSGIGALATQAAVPPAGKTQSVTQGAAAPSGADPALLYVGYAAQITIDPTTVLALDNGALNCGPARLDCSYQWTLIGAPAGSAAALNGSALAAPSLTPDVAGVYGLRLTASAGPRSGTGVFNFRAGGCGGNAPVAGVGVAAPVNAAGPVTQVQLPASALGTVVQLTAAPTTDADNAPAGCGLAQTIGYSWSLASRPTGSATTLAGASLLNPFLQPDRAGDYRVQLTATDSTGRSGSALVTLTVLGNKLAAGAVPGLALHSLSQDAAGNLYAAVVTPNGGGDVSLYRCAAPCATGGWLQLGGGPIETGIGVFTNPGGDEPRPVAVAALPNGSGAFVAYHTLNPTSAGASFCGVKMAYFDGATFAISTVSFISLGGTCAGDGTSLNELGRWLALAVDATGVGGTGPTWHVVHTQKSGAIETAGLTSCLGTCTTAPVLHGFGMASGDAAHDLSVAASNDGTNGLAQILFGRTIGGAHELVYWEGLYVDSSAIGTTWAVVLGNPPGSTSFGRGAQIAVDPATGLSHFAAVDSSNGRVYYGSCNNHASGCHALALGTPVAATAGVVYDAPLGLGLDASGVTVGYVDSSNGLLYTARGVGLPAASFAAPQPWLFEPSGISLVSTGGKTRLLYRAADTAAPANDAVYSLIQ